MNTTEVIVYSSLWGILIILCVTLGDFLKLYDKTKWFDLVIHAFSGALLASTSLTILWELGGITPFLIVLFAFCISMTASVFWEFVEFTFDRIFKTNMQRWKDGNNTGLVDSMTDLISSTVGTFIACAVWFIVML